MPGATTYLYHRFAAAGNRDNETNSNVYDIMLGFPGPVNDTIDIDAGVRYNTYRFDLFRRNYIVGSLAAQPLNDGTYTTLDPRATTVTVLNSLQATTTRNNNSPPKK